MKNKKFQPWPQFSELEANRVGEVLLSNKVNYWTGGEGREFEKEFASYTCANHAIALANGTVALDLALKVLGLGEGDEIIVTSRTFIASVSCIVNAGATPIFADVDEDTQNISSDTISSVLTPKTKAILAVHLAGWPCDMDSVMSLAGKHDLFVIEDCAQAHGAIYKGRPVGSIGHIGAWSFCQDKIMTTGGEGGMVTTNDFELWNRMWSFKDHGKSFQRVYEQDHPPGFRWLHDSFGTNWRMTEMQAAIGRIQLVNMPDWSSKRRAYSKELDDVCDMFRCLRVPKIPEFVTHARYKYYVFVRPEMLKPDWSRDKIVDEILGLGVPCFQGSCSEVYLERAFENTNFRPKNRLKNAKRLGETSLMFLVHPTLTRQSIHLTCEAIDRVMSQASL